MKLSGHKVTGYSCCIVRLGHRCLILSKCHILVLSYIGEKLLQTRDIREAQKIIVFNILSKHILSNVWLSDIFFCTGSKNVYYDYAYFSYLSSEEIKMNISDIISIVDSK